MEESYIYFLNKAHEECINCLGEYASLEITLDESNVEDIPIRVGQIEDSVADIKVYLAEAREQVEQDLSVGDYRKDTLIKLLEALERQLAPVTSCKDILLRVLASIIQNKLLDTDQEATNGPENEPEPLTVKDLGMPETISHVAKINMIIERLTPVIEAMATKCYEISLPGDISDDDGRISKIEESRKSLMNTVLPVWGYSSSMKRHAQSDVILCTKFELLGVLYLALSKTVSWLYDNEDSHKSEGNVEAMAWAEISSLRYFIGSKLISIRDTIGDDEEGVEPRNSLEAFQDAIKWHVGLLIAIMKAATVKQV